MTQAEALNILKSGVNDFLTGEPGAGKTHTVNAYVNYLRDSHVEPAITASTGIAATHIGGMTIHSWSGIGIKTHLDKYELDKITTSEYISKRVQKTKVLIIDEVSMLSNNMLEMVDLVCREIKQNPVPFGGIQVVLVGDFFQLPPIVKNDFRELKQSSLLAEVGLPQTKGRFAYDSNAWARAGLVVCYLSEQHRQDDADFLSLLSGVRANKVSEDHMRMMRERQIEHEDMPENITKLFSHNFDVDRINNAELFKIEEEAKIFRMTSSGSEKLVETIKKGCLSPENLELKVGAVVVCTKNNQKERYVNVTLGVVQGFDEFSNYPIIKTKNGHTITITPMDWTVEENGKIRAQITQVPLRLAWSMTVHKSQGMSLDAAVMDLSQVFEYGQGYVALSRVRRLSGLYILGINEHALKVSPEILNQDIAFKQKSDEAVTVFGKLSGEEMKKMHDNFVLACGGKVQAKKKITSKSVEQSSFGVLKPLEQIREKHPSAYKKWTPEEEGELIGYFKSGKSVKEIAEISGRQRGGIRSRLVKLGLIEK